MAKTEAAAQSADREQPHVAETRKESIIVDVPTKAEPEAKGGEYDPAAMQKALDKLGNSLGETRKENKELKAMLQQLQNPEPEAHKYTYDEDPAQFIQQAVGQAIEERLGPKLQVLESDLNQRRGAAFDEKLAASYPDWKETVATEDFAEWVKASPARVQMYMLADQNFDVDSSVELLKRFRQDQAEAKKSESGAIQAAGMVDGGGDSSGAKVYAASEIKHMMETDPEAYRRWLSTEGMAAYRDGRVDQKR